MFEEYLKCLALVDLLLLSGVIAQLYPTWSMTERQPFFLKAEIALRTQLFAVKTVMARRNWS